METQLFIVVLSSCFPALVSSTQTQVTNSTPFMTKYPDGNFIDQINIDFFHVFRPIHRLVQMGILAFPEVLVYQVPTVATERRERKESVGQKEGRVKLVPTPLQIGSNVFGTKVMTETTDCYR